MESTTLEVTTSKVREFNRFYTQRIGILQDNFLDSPFSLTKVRILYELAHNDKLSVSSISKELGLNIGYLSRIISEFVKKGLVYKNRSKDDGRISYLELTERGRNVYEPLEKISQESILTLLKDIPQTSQKDLLAAMGEIKSIISKSDSSFILRDPQPGDYGWIISHQAALYHEEYKWNFEYEALVAEIIAKYIREYKSNRERCWIAEKDERRIGSVFLIEKDHDTAQIRLLSVDPQARGHGIGTRLVDECIRFAQKVHYNKILLWTNSILKARGIYERAGFKLTNEEKHHSFGQDLIGQTFELNLL